MTRSDLVSGLPDRIRSIQDGSAIVTKDNGTWGASGSCPIVVINFDPTSG